MEKNKLNYWHYMELKDTLLCKTINENKETITIQFEKQSITKFREQNESEPKEEDEEVWGGC